jgi:hypothetical protein
MVRRLTSTSAHAFMIETVFRSVVIASIVIPPPLSEIAATGGLDTLEKTYRHRTAVTTATSYVGQMRRHGNIRQLRHVLTNREPDEYAFRCALCRHHPSPSVSRGG